MEAIEGTRGGPEERAVDGARVLASCDDRLIPACGRPSSR